MSHTELFSPGFTFKELLIRHDASLLMKWDHTAVLAAGLHNLTATVINAVSKAKAKAKPPSAFHPFREQPGRGVVKQDNFNVLRALGDSIVRGK